MKKLVTSLALAALLASGGAMAQTVAPPATPSVVPGAPVASDPGHPRVQELDQRLDNQQTRTTNGVADGQINAKQEARDNAKDAKVSQELSADQAKNGGHVTKAEQNRMNKQLNGNSKRIHKQRTKGSAVTPAPTTPAVTPAQ